MAKVKELEKNKVEIEFEISEEAFAKAEQEAYLKNRGKFNINGFRRGKAPKFRIEQEYGKGVFFEDALDIAFPEAYQKAIDENDIFAVSRPENIDIVSFEQPVTIKVEVWTKPEVELGEYKGITVEYAAKDITDKDVDDKLVSIQEQNARFETVDREAQMGDKVIIDYSGSVDGVKFDGGTAEEQTLDLGSGMFIPGFEEQVVGMKAGEEKDITVTFPEQYHAADLAGKEAVFAVRLQETKQKELPELDDEFAQDISEFDTLAEYRESVMKDLVEQNEKNIEIAKENALIETIVEASNVDIPACMIDNQINYQIQDMANSLMYQGIDLDTYMNYIGTTLDDMKEQMKPGAEKQVKTQLVMQAVLEAEKIEAEYDDIKEFFAPRAEKEEKPVEEIIAGIKEAEMEYIKDRVKFDKMLKVLAENANYVKKEEQAEGEEE